MRVYERTGGHAYGSVYPGPIGAILNPLLKGVGIDAQTDSLPYASTLYGACFVTAATVGIAETPSGCSVRSTPARAAPGAWWSRAAHHSMAVAARATSGINPGQNRSG